jgi:hypothetical protein
MKRTALLVLLALLEVYLCVALFPFHRRETYTGSKVNDALFPVAFFLSVVLVAIGTVCFVSPTTMQDYAVKQSRERFPSNPFLNWMRTVGYVRFLRFIGMVAFVAGVFAAFALLKLLWETAFI